MAKIDREQILNDARRHGRGWQRCLSCTRPRCPAAEVVVNHIDGPYLIWCDGHIRWLTFGERVRRFFGKLDIQEAPR